MRPPTAPRRWSSKTSWLAPPFTSARASVPAGRRSRTLLAPPDDAHRHDADRRRQRDLDVAGAAGHLERRDPQPAAGRRRASTCRRADEMSHGTAVVSAKSADWARQSKGRKRRRCCTVTVPPATVISGAGPSKLARYSSVSDLSPRRSDPGGALGELEAPRRHARERARGSARRAAPSPAGFAGSGRRLGGERGDLRLRTRRACRAGSRGSTVSSAASRPSSSCRVAQLDLALDTGADLARGDRRDDEHAAAVGRVRDAVGVAAALEAVEHGGDRPGREAALAPPARRR